MINEIEKYIKRFGTYNQFQFRVLIAKYLLLSGLIEDNEAAMRGNLGITHDEASKILNQVNSIYVDPIENITQKPIPIEALNFLESEIKERIYHNFRKFEKLDYEVIIFLYLVLSVTFPGKDIKDISKFLGIVGSKVKRLISEAQQRYPEFKDILPSVNKSPLTPQQKFEKQYEEIFRLISTSDKPVYACAFHKFGDGFTDEEEVKASSEDGSYVFYILSDNNENYTPFKGESWDIIAEFIKENKKFTTVYYTLMDDGAISESGQVLLNYDWPNDYSDLWDAIAAVINGNSVELTGENNSFPPIEIEFYYDCKKFYEFTL